MLVPDSYIYLFFQHIYCMLLQCIGVWRFRDEDKEPIIQFLRPYGEIKFQQNLRFTQHNLSSIRENEIYLFFWLGSKKGNSNV